MLAQAIELDATAVARAPVLGYKMIDLARPDDDNKTMTVPQLMRPQPWIETENTPVTIDLKRFLRDNPLNDLMATGTAVSVVAPSLSEALADFVGRWAISSQLRDRVHSSTVKALLIDGGDAEAIVWREGMVIGAHEPLATTLQLLIGNFSEAARRTFVYAKPQSLAIALRLLPDDVKSRYVPEATSFYDQAIRELHECTVKKQRRLNTTAPKTEWTPDGHLKLT